MAPKPFYSPDHIYEALKDWNFMSDGNFKKYDDPIWEDATKVLPAMNKHHIWVYINKNRQNIATRLYGLSTNTKKSKKNIENEDNSVWPIKKSQQLPIINTRIQFTKAEWNKLGLTVKKYGDRNYNILESGWNDKIYYSIWENFKLPCPFSFDSPKIYETEDIFLRIRGFCSKCSNEIILMSISPPDDDDVKIDVTSYDTKSVAHIKKRQLRGLNRETVVNQVRATSVFKYRREEARTRMTFGDQEPADLYNADVLYRAKYQEKVNRLDLKNFPHPILSVLEMKSNPDYSESIWKIAIDKMYVMYWTPTQLHMYKQFISEDKIKSIAVDATGGLVKAIPSMDQSQRVIFLYQIITSYNNKSLPLAQFITEKHDANTLTFWIREWFKNDLPLPKQIVSDFSLALLNASSLAFNNMPLKQYVDECFDQLLKKDSYVNKNTILRIDVAHLIKLVCNWKSLNSNRPHKEFYVRCVDMLMRIKDFNMFEILLTHILTTAYSQFFHSDVSSCTNSVNFLTNLMKTKKDFPQSSDSTIFADLESVKEPKNNKTSKENNKGKKAQPIKTYLDELKKKCQSNQKESIPNNLYNPAFGSDLIKLCKYFVVWTAIIPALFYKSDIEKLQDIETASSASNEEYFKDLKNYVGKNEKIDVWLKEHINSINGTMNLMGAKITVAEEQSQTEFTLDSSIISDVIDSRIDISQLCTTVMETEEQEDPTDEIGNSDNINVGDTGLDEKSNDSSEILDVTGDWDEKNDLETNIIDKFDSVNITANSPKLCSTRLESKPDLDCKTQFQGSLSVANNPSLDRSLTRLRELLNCDLKYFVSNILHDNKVSSNDFIASDQTIDKQKEEKERILLPNNSSNTVGNSIDSPNHDYLHLVDEWGGLLDECEVKGKGYYGRAEPDIENVLTKSKKSKKIFLLVNGSSLEPMKTTQGIIALKNTCPFDSIVHCLRSTYIDWSHYHEYVENTNSKIFNVVKLMSSANTSKDQTGVYEARLECILTVTSPVNGLIDCNLNIGNVAGIVLRDVPSAILVMICSNCNQEERYPFSILSPNLKPMYEGGLKRLEESINLYLKAYKRCCGSCQMRNSVTVELGQHLVIDIEALQHIIKENKNTKENCREFTLSEIPVTINVLGNQFTLTGAIEYVAVIPTAHYRPYVRKSHESWELHDGISKKSKPRRVARKELTKLKKIHLLFFIKKLKT